MHGPACRPVSLSFPYRNDAGKAATAVAAATAAIAGAVNALLCCPSHQLAIDGGKPLLLAAAQGLQSQQIERPAGSADCEPSA